jgi:hypothetical protein
LIEGWCAARNEARGETLSIAQLWELSKLWYHNRLSPDYHGRTAAQVGEIFKQLGLTAAFWLAAVDPDAPQK